MPRISSLTFLLLAASIFQVQKHTCDHAAPPDGMHYVCSPTDSCDCHLEKNSPESGGRTETPATMTPDSCPAADLKYFVAPAYPVAARAAKKQDTVIARLLLDTSGVPQVTIEAGDAVFREPVESALRKWRFAPATAPRTVTVTLTFAIAGDPTENMITTVSGSSPLNLVIAARPPRP